MDIGLSIFDACLNRREPDLTVINPIADLLLQKLPVHHAESDEIVKALSFDDHLLRRFGQLGWVRRAPCDIQALTFRAVADEIWVLVNGKVECLCRDLRPGSPSENFESRFEISEPSRLLIPFGVAFGWRALENPALMLRCSTHQDGDHPDDRSIFLGAGE
jgi:dTDP-4-dehydrorhamnose 3,5-epimerase-like enzyme